ncbi:MAG: CYTH domain-containing protein, partial [Gemmatimonadales bacterium]
MEPLGAFRFDVSTIELLNRLAEEPPPLGLRAGPLGQSFHRDVYFDTPDEALARRGITCRLRYRVDDRRSLALAMRGVAEGVLIRPGAVFETEVAEIEAAAVFAGTSEPARRLRALVDPARLQAVTAVETDRRSRPARAGWFGVPFAFWYDRSTVSSGARSRSYHELGFRA